MQDVAEICAPLVVSRAEAEKPLDGGSPRTDGFIYLMKSGKNHKIGRSTDVGRRSFEIGLLLPESLTEVHRIATDDPEGIERYWHRRFAERRAKCEWFLLTPKDVASFRRRRRSM